MKVFDEKDLAAYVSDFQGRKRVINGLNFSFVYVQLIR